MWPLINTGKLSSHTMHATENMWHGNGKISFFFIFLANKQTNLWVTEFHIFLSFHFPKAFWSANRKKHIVEYNNNMTKSCGVWETRKKKRKVRGKEQMNLCFTTVSRERDGAFSEWKSMWGPDRGSVAELKASASETHRDREKRLCICF